MTKEELRELIVINDRINSKQRQKEELRELMETVRSSTNYSGERVQTSPVNNAENNIIKLIDLEADINRDIDKLADKKKMARQKINQISGLRGTVLEMKYLECLDWDTIAYKLDKSVQSIYRYHGEALLEVRDVK